MATQNLSDYTLILNIKQIFKELLQDKLLSVNLIDAFPTDKSQLPCLIISCMDYKLQPVGLGGIIGTIIKDKVETDIVEGTRLLGTFKFDLWVEKATNSFEKLDHVAKVIMDTIGGEGLTLRKKGILDASVEKISEPESSKDKAIWQIKEEGIKKSLYYKVLYEASYVKEPTQGVIKGVEVEIKDGFKEKMVIGKKVEVPPAPTPSPPPPPPPQEG